MANPYLVNALYAFKPSPPSPVEKKVAIGSGLETTHIHPQRQHLHDSFDSLTPGDTSANHEQAQHGPRPKTPSHSGFTGLRFSIERYLPPSQHHCDQFTLVPMNKFSPGQCQRCWRKRHGCQWRSCNRFCSICKNQAHSGELCPRLYCSRSFWQDRGIQIDDLSGVQIRPSLSERNVLTAMGVLEPSAMNENQIAPNMTHPIVASFYQVQAQAEASAGGATTTQGKQHPSNAPPQYNFEAKLQPFAYPPPDRIQKSANVTNADLDPRLKDRGHRQQSSAYTFTQENTALDNVELRGNSDSLNSNSDIKYIFSSPIDLSAAESDNLPSTLQDSKPSQLTSRPLPSRTESESISSLAGTYQNMALGSSRYLPTVPSMHREDAVLQQQNIQRGRLEPRIQELEDQVLDLQRTVVMRDREIRRLRGELEELCSIPAGCQEERGTKRSRVD